MKLWLAAVLVAGATPLAAQDTTPPADPVPETQVDPVPGSPGLVQAQILVVDPEALFAGSEVGQRLNASLDQAAQQLAAENREIEDQLSAEERDLTDKRASLSPEEFRILADEFDQRVTEKRNTQAQKADLLDRMRADNRVKFLRLIVPVLATMMQEAGALVILNRSDVLLSATSIDITDAAIARINADLTIREVQEDLPQTDLPDPDQPDTPVDMPVEDPALVPDPAN